MVTFFMREKERKPRIYSIHYKFEIREDPRLNSYFFSTVGSGALGISAFGTQFSTGGATDEACRCLREPKVLRKASFLAICMARAGSTPFGQTWEHAPAK